MTEENNLQHLFIRPGFSGTGENNPWSDLLSFIETLPLDAQWARFRERIQFAPLRLTARDDVKAVAHAVREWRNKGENRPQQFVIFVVLSPFYEMAQEFARLRIKIRSDFGDYSQALFCAELIPAAEHDKGAPFLNILFLEDLICPDQEGCRRIKKIEQAIDTIYENNSEWYFSWQRRFYATFVDFYDRKTIDENSESLLEKCDKVRMALNGFDPDQPHAAKLEIFRAPIPFVYHDLFRVRIEVLEKIAPDCKLHFFWIDNKPFDEKKHKKLLQILKEGLGVNLVAVDLLSIDGNALPLNELDDDLKPDQIPSFPLGEKDIKCLKKIIKKYHFVLLDFFLDSRDTYFAFDLIEELAKLRLNEEAEGTTWYLIASAVHDSVTRYAQSGLLAAYYQSAVVNSGDDPQKREIIFLYKLLTFIDSRARSFKSFETGVLENKLFVCREQQKGKNCSKCLHQLTSMPRKYLAEYNDIKNVFPKLASEKIRKIAELIILLVDQFFWLPEADWAIIKMQIMHLIQKRNEANGITDEREFSCQYIKEEMDRRAEEY